MLRQPMGAALAIISAGAGLFLARRVVARAVVRNQAFWFDRALNEDGVAFWYGVMGGLLAAFGVVCVFLAR